MGYSTGSTLGRGIAGAVQRPSENCREDFERVKRFINEHTGFVFAHGSVSPGQMILKAVSKSLPPEGS